MSVQNGNPNSARNKAAIVLLGPEELEARGALGAANWAQRVDFVEDLMTSVSWAPATGRHLAKLWGLSNGSIGLMSAEASRRVLKAYREAPEEVVARLCAGLDHVVQIALNKERSIGCKQCGSVTSHPDPDCNAAIKGQVALAQILGLAPNRHDMELKYEALDDVALMRTVIRAALGTPHLRPILLAELQEAQGALVEAVEADAAGAREAEQLPCKQLGTGASSVGGSKDSPVDLQSHGNGRPEHVPESTTGAGRQGSDGQNGRSQQISESFSPFPAGSSARPAGVTSTIPLPEKRPAARVKTGKAPEPKPDCRCGHEVDCHYLLRSCWKCGCLSYAAKEAEG